MSKTIGTNLFEDIFRRRDEERERVKKADIVVKGKDLPVENNRMGLYKWYMHPSLSNITSRAMLYWVQEIPPGSHSGKQKSQGGRVHYILEGHGYTIIDGVKHEWEKRDFVLIPIKGHGTEYQHFNADQENRVRLIAAEFNWYDALGVDMGAEFEQLENSPDFKP